MDNTPKRISQKQQEEFEQILLGQMDLKEEALFHKKLDNNDILRKQFEEFKNLFFAIEEVGLRNRLDKFHEGVQEEKGGQKLNFNVYQIAAGIIVLIALGIWVFNRQSPNEKLYQQFFTPDPGLPTVMGTNDNYAFYEAMVDYKQGNYSVAIEKWEKLLGSKPKNDTLNYFLGVSHLANNNVDIAIDYLKLLTDEKSSVFYKDINTYLGLALLKKGKIDEAKSILAKSNSPKGQKVLSKLK